MAGLDTSTIKAKSGGNLTITDDNDNETLVLEETTSAVNEITIKNAATGNNPSIKCTGEANTGITFANSENEEILILDSVASSVNEVTIASAATGDGPIISATGETNVDLNLTAKGSGVVNVTSDIKITGTTPLLTIGDAGAEDTMIVFDGNAQDYRIGLDDGTDKLEIGHGVAHGTNTAIAVDSSGQVTTLNLAAAAVAVADDHIVILDGGATGAPKAESIQDLLTAIAGSGISVSGDQLVADGGGTADAVAADNISAGDAAVNLTTSSGAITVDSNASTVSIDGHTGVTITSSSSGQVDITSAADVDINAATGIAVDGTTVSIDGTDDSNLTVTASGKDLDLAVAGGGTQELRLASAGTGAAAIHVNASAGGIDIDSADMIDIDAADEITIDTTSADGHIAITSAHTAGDAILISANANAGSILDIDAGILDIDIQAEATIDAVGIALVAGSGELDLTTTGTLDVNANALDMDLTDSSSITITSSEAAEDLTIQQVGANDSSIIIQAAGTGANAIHLNATGGSIDIDSADNITIDASDNIALTTGTADGLITIHSAHTAGQAILIDANANAGSILDVDAGILDMDIQGAATITAGGLFKTAAAGVEIENPTDAGAVALLIDNKDVDAVALDIDALNTTADILTVDGDVLTTGKLAKFVSNSSTTDNRGLVSVINENAAATGAIPLSVRNDAIPTAGRATVKFEDTGNNTRPILLLKNSSDSANGPILRFDKARGAAGEDGDIIGNIHFFGFDDAGTPAEQKYAGIVVTIGDATAADAAGKMHLQVCEQAGGSGTVTTGLLLDGDTGADGRIDVTIGAGTASITSVAGKLDLGDRNITNVGDIALDSLTPDGSLITINGPTEVANDSSAGGPALLLDNDDVDENVLKIEAANTTGNIIDITSDDALTTGKIVHVDVNNGTTSALTPVYNHYDFDKDGVTGDGVTQTFKMFDIDLNDLATNHANANVTMTGMSIDVVSANAQGTLTNQGAVITCSGADKNNGIEITADTHIKLFNPGDANDFAEFEVGANGEMKIKTTDGGGTGGNLLLLPDGAVIIETSAAPAVGGGFDGAAPSTPIITVAKVNEETITTIQVDIGGGSIVSSAHAGDAIGNDGESNAFLFRLDEGTNGLIYKAEMICTEAPTTGDADINVSLHSSPKAEDADAESGGHVIINAGTQTKGKFSPDDPTAMAAAAGGHNDYVHLTHGGTTAGTYDAGKLIIKLYGYLF